MKPGLILIFLLSIQSISGQNAMNLFKNGSFDGKKGEDSHGVYWSVGSTPDLNDTSGNVNTTSGYTWIKKPLPSRDGGTWQNLYSNREYLEQTVNLEQGQVYTILFEYAAQGIKALPSIFSDPVGINVYINDVLLFTSRDDRTPYTWENSCFQFTAKVSVVSIRFSASKEQYVGIDGVTLLKGNLCIRVP